MHIDRNALMADENLKHSTATEVSALQQRAEDLLRKARERREEAVRAELREKIARGVELEAAALALAGGKHLADLIRAGEFG